jgi:hypothetical protein
MEYLKIIIIVVVLIWVMALFSPAASDLVDDVVAGSNYFHKFALCCVLLIFMSGLIRFLKIPSRKPQEKPSENTAKKQTNEKKEQTK